MAAMLMFLADFDDGKDQGRYVNAELPSLSFADASFDLALCSHFLFLYSDQLDESLHRASIEELCRVARAVRIFPLVAFGGRPSPYVRPTSRTRLPSRWTKRCRPSSSSRAAASRRSLR